MASIKIVGVPDGEAPLHIRQAWIGCVLPLRQKAYGPPRRWLALGVGVISGGKKSWLARLFSARPMTGYPVRVQDALQVLEKTNPSAAQWWRENTPHLLAPNKVFIFNTAACKEEPFE